MLDKFELGDNITEATKNIHCENSWSQYNKQIVREMLPWL